MAGLLIPIIMVVIAAGLFFGYVAPAYDDVQVQRAEVAQYTDALARFDELKKLRDQLSADYQRFSASDMDKLLAVLPDNLDNIRFALDLDTLAGKHAIRILTLAIGAEDDESTAIVKSGTKSADEARMLGTAMLNFEIEGTYKNLVAFLRDLERNLRLVDITDLAFEEAKDKETAIYTVGVRMYWLK